MISERLLPLVKEGFPKLLQHTEAKQQNETAYAYIQATHKATRGRCWVQYPVRCNAYGFYYCILPVYMHCGIIDRQLADVITISIFRIQIQNWTLNWICFFPALVRCRVFTSNMIVMFTVYTWFSDKYIYIHGIHI